MSKQSGFAHLTLIVAVLAVAAVGGGVGYYVYNSNKTPVAHLADEIALPDSLANLKSLDEIRTLAAADLGSATIVGVELDREDGKLVFKVKLSDGRILLFDATTGSAISKSEGNEVENDEDIPAGFVAGISIDQARQIALDRRPGKTIKKIELEMENGVGVYSVRFTDSGRVDVNATNGAIVKVEAGDGEHPPEDNSSDDSNDDSGDDNSGSGSGN